MPSFLGLDLGTTHIKAGLISWEGRVVQVVHATMPAHRDARGFATYQPEEVWQAVVTLIRRLLSSHSAEQIVSIGIGSMAETGLIVNRETGEAYTPMLPWFDGSSKAQGERLKALANPQERFYKSGIRPTFKSSLAKILWLKEDGQLDKPDQVWLSIASYIAFRLGARMAIDYSIAGRTYAFDINTKDWDQAWLQQLELPADLFPPAVPGGTVFGVTGAGQAEQTGLKAGIPIVIGGHDHLCAAYAAGAMLPGEVFDSMGTAETLLGTLGKRQLGRDELQSGLVFGLHVVPDTLYWMGGLSTAGGSVEWVRKIFADPALNYQQINELLAQTKPEPTGILYFPYLTGSGSPHTDGNVRAAFVGLDMRHTRGEILRAVLEGAAFELEFIRRKAAVVMPQDIQKITAAGGGTRNPYWMQIKADVYGIRLEVLGISEATLTGAALLGGAAAGHVEAAEYARKRLLEADRTVYEPDPSRHRVYQELFNNGFLALQEPLRSLKTYS